MRSPFVGTTDPPEKPQRREGDEPKPPKEIQIDLEGIGERIVPLPVPEGLYHRIIGTKEEVLFSSFPIEGSLNRPTSAALPQRPTGRLSGYKLAERRLYTIVRGISDFTVDTNGKRVAYRSGNSLRVGNVGTSWEAGGGGGGRSGGFGSPFGRQLGFVDLSRVKVSVEPRAEWRQMFREAWRLQREHFWTGRHVGPWTGTRSTAATSHWSSGSRRRSEFSDLLWELQGELGTSHAYEMGGDYRQAPDVPPGRSLRLRLGRGDRAATGSRTSCGATPGDVGQRSPLPAPGLGRRARATSSWRSARPPLRRDLPLGALLVNQAGRGVVLTVQSESDGAPRAGDRADAYRRTTRPLPRLGRANRAARARGDRTGGVGYVHIPDMGADGLRRVPSRLPGRVRPRRR